MAGARTNDAIEVVTGGSTISTRVVTNIGPGASRRLVRRVPELPNP